MTCGRASARPISARGGIGRVLGRPCRFAAPAVLVLLLALSASPTGALAETGGYPDWNMPCEHYPYATSGACANYDWGPVHNGSQSTTWSSRGYGYRNCTDWVAWRLQQLGIPDSKTRGLGNGGQWAANAPAKGLGVSGTPQAGDAAVRVGNPGHVAFVEAVSGGTITVSQYNAAGTGLYSVATGTPAGLNFQQFVHFGANPGGGGGGGLSDGSFVSTPDGRVYKIVGCGPPTAPQLLTYSGAPQPTTAISHQQLASLRPYPKDGTFVGTSGDDRVYEIVGGAPLYVSNWGAVGGPKAAIGIDRWDVENTSDPHAHLRQHPVDGTFVDTSAARVYRIAGGAPFYVSTWSVFGDVQPSVRIDQWDVDNTSDEHAHLRAAPLDGTLVEGLPSHSHWSFSSGHRSPVAANGTAIGVDDAGLGVFPVAVDSGPADGGGNVNNGDVFGALTCSVPKLKHKTRHAAKRALAQAHCRLGNVHRPKHVRGHRVLHVRKQSARPGTEHPANYRVSITLGG